MAPLFRRARVYWADLSVDGKRVRKSLKTRYKEEALDRLKELQATLAGRRGITFADFKRQYIQYAWSHKPASADREEQRLKIIEAFLVSHNVRYLDDVTSWHIEQLKAHLKETKSPATVNRYLQLLRGMFYRAVDWEVTVKPNPVKRVKFMREQPEIYILTEEELTRVLSAADSIKLKARSPLQKLFPDLIRIAANTGLRKSELMNLLWKDVRSAEIVVTGKGNRRRSVPLNDTAGDIIRRQPRGGEYVFEFRGRTYKDILRRTVERIRSDTGIPFSFHQLRHYFTSALLAQGVDIVTISEILGHAKPPTTLIYSHTSAERKREAVTKLVTKAKGPF